MVLLITVITTLPTAYLIFRDFYLKNIDKYTHQVDKKYIVLFSLFVLFVYFIARRNVSLFNEPFFVYALGFRPPYFTSLLLLLNSIIEYAAWSYVHRYGPKKHTYIVEPLLGMLVFEFLLYTVLFCIYVLVKIFILEPLGIMSPYYPY
jgi:hypothetical protein